MNATAICKVLLCHLPLAELLLLQRRSREELVRKNGYDTALLAAQMDGQMEPGVNSTKDNHTAPKDSNETLGQRGTHQPCHQLILQLVVTQRLSPCHIHISYVLSSEMKMGSGTGSGPALQNQRTNLL